MTRSAALAFVSCALVAGCSAPQKSVEPSPLPADSAPAPVDVGNAAAPHASASLATAPTPTPGSSAAPAPPGSTLGGADPGAPATAPISSSGIPLASNDDALQERCSKVAVPLEKRLFEKWNACYRTGKQTNPNLEGTVKVAYAVSNGGKVTSVKLTGGAKELGKAVTDCMLKEAKADKFDADPCAGSTVAVSKVYGAGH